MHYDKNWPIKPNRRVREGLILSEALTELEQRGDRTAAEVLKRVSPVAWQHINFYGRYQFVDDFTPIDLQRLRQQLSSEEVSRLYATADR